MQVGQFASLESRAARPQIQIFLRGLDGSRIEEMGARLSVTDGVSWRVDATGWPVLVNRTLKPRITDQQLLAGLAALDSILAERVGRFVMVHDYSGFESLTAMQRRIVADHGRANRARTQQRCLGIAFVMDSAVARGILTAVQWVYPSAAETKVFGALDEALAWARMRAANALSPVGQGT